MKTLAFLLVMLAAVPALAVEKDKASHFVGAAILGLAADTVLYHKTELDRQRRVVASAGLAFIPGLSIEVADEFSGTHFSWYDLLADALGSVTGVVAGELVNGRLWLSASAHEVRLSGRW